MSKGKAIANRIRTLCEEKNMTLRELGEKSGLGYRRVYRYAAGVFGDFGFYTALRICDTLGVSLNEFIDSPDFQEFRL